MKFTLHPALLIYPKTIDDERFFVAEIHCAIPPVILESPKIVSIINRLPKEFTQKQVIDIFLSNDIEHELAEETFSFFVKERIFIQRVERALLEKTPWFQYGWVEAFRYNWATKDFPFLQMHKPDAFLKDNQRMVHFREKSEVPSLYQIRESLKRYPAPSLHKKNIRQTLKQVQMNTMSPVEKLGFLFSFCFGKRGRKVFGIQGSFLRKVTPSGGARHPVEVYLVVFDYQGLENGVYHYNVKTNELDFLRKGNFYLEAQKATFDLFSKYQEKPKCLLIFTTVFERSMWRYRDSRSWRAPLVDVGHALMCFRQIASLLHFDTYTYQKFEDQKIAELIGVNIVEQSPLYVGTLL